jgi:hypothetical protein
MKIPPPSALLSADPRISSPSHWRGAPHSQLRIRKPKSGQHWCRTPDEVLALMRSVATRWSHAKIARTLNLMGMPTDKRKPEPHTASARPPGERDSCLPFRRDEWRMADDVRGRCDDRRHASPHPSPDQGRHPLRRAGSLGRALPDPPCYGLAHRRS